MTAQGLLRSNIFFNILSSLLCLIILTILTIVTPFSSFSHQISKAQPPSYALNRNLRAQAQGFKQPLASSSLHLYRRGIPGAVYICIEGNFRGDCAWISPNEDCHIPGTGNNSPKSIGPDPGGFCILYEKATCSGKEVRTLRFPGLDSAIPEFGGIRCFADEQANSTANAPVSDATGSADGLVQTSIRAGDPRLAGGIGSAERERLKEVMKNMEEDSFREGMIGLKKGHYY